MKVDITLEDLKKLIEDESKRITPDTNIVKVSKAKLIEGLESTEKDILEKYNQTHKLWKKSVKLYREFLQKTPGSRQLKPPDSVPTLPASYEEFKGYKRMIDATVQEEIEVEWDFLKELFRISAKAINDMRTLRNNYLVASSGTGAIYSEDWGSNISKY